MDKLFWEKCLIMLVLKTADLLSLYFHQTLTLVELLLCIIKYEWEGKKEARPQTKPERSPGVVNFGLVMYCLNNNMYRI